MLQHQQSDGRYPAKSPTLPHHNYSVNEYHRSPLTQLNEAPMQGSEGAPDAWIEIVPEIAAVLDGLAVGQDIIVITWLHQADRTVLKVYPRDD
jgi:tRNA (Thr-GGU) A37 N-methylase